MTWMDQWVNCGQAKHSIPVTVQMRVQELKGSPISGVTSTFQKGKKSRTWSPTQFQL